MQNRFQSKQHISYQHLIVFLIGLINTVIYSLYSLSVYGKINGGAEMGNHFSLFICGLLFAGTLTALLGVFKSNWTFVSLLASFFFSAAFGYYINDRLIMFEEMINKIYGMMESGADFKMVVLVFVLDFICILALIIDSFTDKSGRKVDGNECI